MTEDSSKEEELKDIDQDDLVKQIELIVKKISPMAISDSAPNDLLHLKVDINDNLAKINNVLSSIGDASGFLTLNGKVVEKPDEITFAKMFCTNQCKIGVNVMGEGS
jgi:hypothetical protein